MMQLYSILLIDDDPVTNFLHKTLLEQVVFVNKITICTNGEKALLYLEQAFAENSFPDLIFVDLNMPVLDGIGFLQAYIKEHLHLQNPTAIAVLTSSVNPKDISRVNDLGIAEYITKPLCVDHVYALLNIPINDKNHQ